jgi:hypothetical protein
MNPLCAKAKNDKTGLGTACGDPRVAIPVCLYAADSLCASCVPTLFALVHPRGPVHGCACVRVRTRMHAHARTLTVLMYLALHMMCTAGADPEEEGGFQEDEGEDGIKRKRGGAKKWTSGMPMSSRSLLSL